MNTRVDGLGWGFWASMAMGFAWCLWRALASEAWILDDELSHYMISRDVWESPKELWHSWSRPGRNILQFIPAYFGIEAARLWTLGLSVIAVWLTGLEARRMKMAGLSFLPLLICFQCWFPDLSYSVLTQVPFMLVWIAGVFFAMRQRMILAALCWGYLGLIRHEGIALSGLWGLWVIFAPEGMGRYLIQRKWSEALKALKPALWIGFWTLVPMIVMNLATYGMRGVWPFLMFFEPKPTEQYGSGPIWLYLFHLLYGAGLPVVLLMLIGCRRGWSEISWKHVLYATYPAYLIMHSLIFWKGLFASGGYYHFIMPMAPAIGLLALKGLNVLRERCRQRVTVVTLVLVVWSGMLMLHEQWNVSDSHIEGMPNLNSDFQEPTSKPQQNRFDGGMELVSEWVDRNVVSLQVICPPLKKSRFSTGLHEASQWIEGNVTDEQWIPHHIAVSFWLNDKTIGEQLGSWDGFGPDSDELESGAIVVWDAVYSAQTFGYTEDALAANDWEEVQRYAHGTVRIYQKR